MRPEVSAGRENEGDRGEEEVGGLVGEEEAARPAAAAAKVGQHYRTGPLESKSQ